MSEREEAWAAVHEALPVGWTVGHPPHHLEEHERSWHVIAVDLRSRAPRRLVGSTGRHPTQFRPYARDATTGPRCGPGGLDESVTLYEMGDTSVIAVGPKGRVVIPAQIRRELGIREGSELVAMVEGQAVVLVPRSAIKSRLRSIFADVPVSMRQELIADRRADATRESGGT